MPAKRYLIIGDGAAGTTAAQAIRAADSSATVAILSDDPHAAYFRAALTNYLLGELREEQIWAVPPTFYDEFAIHRIMARVAAVDTQRGQVWLSQGGRPLDYDALLIGAGSRARPPTFEGAWLPGVMTMRTLQDVRRVMDLVKLRGLRSAIVVGGGPLALEWAHGLSHRGVRVTMMLREPRFLPGVIDAVASDLLLARLRNAGVDVRLGEEVQAALPGPDGRVAGAVTKSGTRLAAELVAVAIGVVCNSEFLRGSGVVCTPNGGVQVDAAMRTTVANVFAAGDIASVGGKLLQLWEPARLQARIAAGHMTGTGSSTWSPGVHYMATRLYDLDVASIGQVVPAPSEPTGPAGFEEIVDFPQRTGRISYRKLCVRNGKLVGALLFGEREARVRRWGRAYKRLIDERIDVSGIKRELQDASFDLGAWMQTNVLVGKPGQPSRREDGAHDSRRREDGAHDSTLAMAQAARQIKELKGTHLIRFSELPKAPASLGRPQGPTTDRGTALTPQVPAPGTQVLAATPAGEASRLSLQGAFGTYELTGATAILGRDPQSALALNDPQVSFTHAQVSRNGPYFYLRDLGSASGTWLNATPVTIPVRLKDGDRIRLGGVEIVAHVRGGPPPSIGTIAHDGLPPPSLFAVGPASGPTPHIEVRSGQSLGLGFALTTSPMTIGRDPGCAMRLDDESIAPHHATLQASPQGQWAIADASGRGATLHNGRAIGAGIWVPLGAGDVVMLGEVVIVFAVGHAHVALQPANRASTPGPAAPTLQSAHPTPRGRVSIRSATGAVQVAELQDHLIVGNQPGACHLLVQDPHVLPQHLEIAKRPDGFYARALDLRVATTWRSQVLGAMPVKLTSGDVLTLGPRVSVLFEGYP
jgi:NADPH-dependent 2,4-dienoyl-CoA reductase/sulfur reductase-like enzyme/pSer/pThr/pTyr-binding forkhead associated (FHA) protein